MADAAPAASSARSGPAPVSPSISLALAVNWIAFTLVFASFLSRRIEIARLEDEQRR